MLGRTFNTNVPLSLILLEDRRPGSRRLPEGHPGIDVSTVPATSNNLRIGGEPRYLSSDLLAQSVANNIV